MKKGVMRIVACTLAGTIVLTGNTSVAYAATAQSILPTEGAILATGDGVSLNDIKAQLARNLAKEKVQTVHASVVKSASSTVALTANVSDNVGVSIKAETPASKAVKEAKEAATSGGTSVVGSATTAAQMEVVDKTDGSLVQTATTVVTETSPTKEESDAVAATIAATESTETAASVSGNEIQPAAATTDAPSINVGIDSSAAEGEDAELVRKVIAVCDGFVNVRATPSEDGEVVGKLYNHSAGEWLDKDGDWYKIKSGNVTGYVKGSYVITGNDAVQKAAEVGNRVAVVNTTTLKVREAASLDASVLGLVPIEDRLTVLEEKDDWVKVSIEEGDGWVSKEFVNVSTEFPKAESKEEEEARLRKEEADRKAANAAAAKAQKKGKSSGGSSSSGSGASYSASGSGAGASVANYALQFVGNPYVYGGTSLTNGTDCSGFTMGVYRNFGVSLPHSSGAQRSCGYSVGSIANAQAGDIVCYSGHVGIYIGGGQIVHASTARTGIKVSNAGYRSILDVRRIF